MKLSTLADVYLDQIQDMHSCERQLIRAIPKMMKAASNPDLKSAFAEHLEVTREHLARLDRILEDLGKPAGRKVCKATVGLVEEGGEMIDADGEDQARDVGLICAAQKIEHYEIASYGCLQAFALQLGRNADAKLLEKTLNDEKKANDALSELATASVNEGAMA
ncbi:MAG: ferritin-like domain-containing protein [Phycisphaerae bacterium]|jgi:ferritin-like metal-binding protein YciE